MKLTGDYPKQNEGMFLSIKKINAGRDTLNAYGFSKSKSTHLFFQPKLTMGPVDDVCEREADAMAEKVMRMPSDKNQQPFFSSNPLQFTSVLQSKCAACEEEEPVQRFPEDDPIHDPILDQFSEETGIPREQASQHSEAYRRWLASQVIAPVIHSSCASQRDSVRDTVNEALQWIDDIYDQLLRFEANEIFNLENTSADQLRISSALQQTFHTIDPLYVNVIRSRFYHIGRLLREPDRVTILCGGPGCVFSGSSFVEAYVDTPYQIHLCGFGNIPTFIHEMGHAVIPQVGIRNTIIPGRGRGIIDRAYEHESVFHHLSPEEALDNAESYGILADALHNRRTGNLVAPQPDQATNCGNSTTVLAAFARSELWTRRTWQLVGQWNRRLNGQPLTALSQVDLEFLNTHLPLVTSTADLSALNNSLTEIYTSAYSSSFGTRLNCLANSTAGCSGDIVGLAANGKVTSSSVIQGTQSVTGEIDLCKNWFLLSENDRIKTIFVLFLLARIPRMVSGIDLARAFQLANFAEQVILETLAPPTTHDAIEHLLQEEPTAPVSRQHP